MSLDEIASQRKKTENKSKRGRGRMNRRGNRRGLLRPRSASAPGRRMNSRPIMGQDNRKRIRISKLPVLVNNDDLKVISFFI